MKLEVGDVIYIEELGYWYEVETNGISKGIWWYEDFYYYPEIFELNNWHITKIARKGQITELGDKEND